MADLSYKALHEIFSAECPENKITIAENLGWSELWLKIQSSEKEVEVYKKGINELITYWQHPHAVLKTKKKLLEVHMLPDVAAIIVGLSGFSRKYGKVKGISAEEANVHMKNVKQELEMVCQLPDAKKINPIASKKKTIEFHSIAYRSCLDNLEKARDYLEKFDPKK